MSTVSLSSVVINHFLLIQFNFSRISKDPSKAGEPLIIVGYGQTVNAGPLSDIPLKVYAEKARDCTLNKNQICTLSAGKGPCMVKSS